MKLYPIDNDVRGHLDVPGDKSISHRSVMLGSMAHGTTIVDNFLDGDDCLHTVNLFKALGVLITKKENTLTINSNGLKSLNEPKIPLYFGNSGTTARLMLGVFAGLPFHTMIYGDPFLSERPMDRVLQPLRKMGAKVNGRKDGSLLPLAIQGSELTGIDYQPPVKSAQVKSAILLAGLLANNKTTVIEQTKTRDHTEKMLEAFGADIKVRQNKVTITNKNELQATNIMIPGDISSAAFFLVAAAIVPGSHLVLHKVGLNDTRTGIIDILKQMNANIQISNYGEMNKEAFGDITVRYRPLKSITIQGDMIPRLIDELPIIALLATQANGKTIIRDAEELRVKETDRIKAVVDVLSKFGANIKPTEDGMIIHGETKLTGAHVSAYSDHRMAMMAAIASLIASSAVIIDDVSSITVSYPQFFSDLQQITK